MAVLDERRDRRLHGVRRRRAARCRSTRASCRRRSLGCDVQAFDERRPPARRRGRRARHHPADAVDAAVLLERPRRRAAARGVLRRCTPASGATATGSRSRRAGRRSSTAAATRRSTAAACGWGRARSTAPCSRSTRSSTRSSSTSTAGWRCSSCCATGAALDDELRARDRAARPRGLLAAPRPRRRLRRRRGPAHAVGQDARGARSSGSSPGTPPEQAASRDSLANPAALDWFVGVRARASAARAMSRAGAKKKQRQRARAADDRGRRPSDAAGEPRRGEARRRRRRASRAPAPRRPLAPGGPRRRAAPRRDLGAVSAHGDRHGASASCSSSPASTGGTRGGWLLGVGVARARRRRRRAVPARALRRLSLAQLLLAVLPVRRPLGVVVLGRTSRGAGRSRWRSTSRSPARCVWLLHRRFKLAHARAVEGA